MHFYELHEGDADFFTDVLLTHEDEFDQEQFLELVLEARAAVVRTFEEDTLVEAVARQLERRHGFTFVSDARLSASVEVSLADDGTALATVDAVDVDEPEVDDDGDPAAELDGGFRSLVVDLERNDDLD